MKLGDSRESVGPGFLPLRSEGFIHRGFDLSFREMVAGVKVTDRLPYPEGFGQYVIDEDSVGDLNGAQLWEVSIDQNQARSIPQWRFATPVMSKRFQDQMEPEGCGPAPDFAFVPVKQVNVENVGGNAPPGGPVMSTEWIRDERLAEKSLFRPTDDRGKRLWNKHTANTFGISLAADREDRQQDLFLPTDPRLIAVHRLSDPAFGTLVCDVRGFDTDIDRRAPLQSLVKVIGRIRGCGMNTREPILGLNVEPTECLDTEGGIFYWPRSGVGAAIAQERYAGPVSFGSPQGDKHQLGTDEDGHPINSGHLHVNSYFFESTTRDAPLKFDGTWPGASSGPMSCEVFLEYDNDLQHGHPCGPKSGKWRWRATCMEESSIPPSEPSPFRPPTPPPFRPPPPLPQSGIENFDPAGEFGEADPAAENFFTFGAIAAPPEPEIGFGSAPQLFALSARATSQLHAVEFPTIGEVDPETRAFSFTTIERGAPAIVFTAQFFEPAAIDYRNWMSIPRDSIDAAKRWTPVTARLEAFGRQANAEWNYRCQPRGGQARYQQGTTDGGVVFMPPELDVPDLDSALWDPGLPSRAHFVFSPGTRLGFGRPSTSTGGMRPGSYVLRGGDEPVPNGSIRFSLIDSSGLEEDVLQLTKNGSLAFGRDADTAGGKGVLAFKNVATEPIGIPMNGGLLYCLDGALIWRGPRGTKTCLVPA